MNSPMYLYLLNLNPLILVLLSTMDSKGDINERKNYVTVVCAYCNSVLK